MLATIAAASAGIILILLAMKDVFVVLPRQHRVRRRGRHSAAGNRPATP